MSGSAPCTHDLLYVCSLGWLTKPALIGDMPDHMLMMRLSLLLPLRNTHACPASVQHCCA